MEKENLDKRDSIGIKPDVNENEALRVAVDFADWMKKKGWKKTETYFRNIGEDGDGCPQFEYSDEYKIKEEYEMEQRIEARRKAKATVR